MSRGCHECRPPNQSYALRVEVGCPVQDRVQADPNHGFTPSHRDPLKASVDQQLLWYALVLLAAAGAVQAGRRDAFAAWLFTGMIGVSALVIAPHEGNIGTLVRHRDSIVPFVVCLSAIALASVLSSVSSTVAALVDDSIVVGSVRRLTRSLLIDRAAGIRAWWRESAIAAATDELRHVEDWVWLRRLGIALLAGAVLSAVLETFGSLAWPPLLLWVVTAACALVLIVHARGFACAWREKHVTARAAYY